MSLAKTTIGFGVILGVIGVAGYFLADPDPETGRSVTALIPSFIGILLVICGIFAMKENLRKLFMHIAVTVGLVGFLGCASRIPKSLAASREAAGDATIALVSQSLTAVLLLVFIVLCVKSFIDARKTQKV